MSTAGGRVATAIDFGGTDGQIDIGDQASLDFGTGSFTYSVWVYVTSSVGTWDMPWWKGGQCSGCNGYDIELGTGNWHASISDGGATYPRLAFGPEASFLGRWVYLATVVDRGTDEFRVYADGSFVTQMGIPGFGSLSNTDSATLGNRDDGTNPLNGILDEVRVMSGVRSADWIAAQDLSVRDNFITYGNPTAQSMVQTGSYLGDGLDNRILTGVGFTPDVVIIKGDQALEAVIRTSTMSGDASKPVIVSLGIGPDMVQSLDTDGFTVGQDAHVNTIGVAYHWTAFKTGPGQMTVGTYPGNSSDNRSIVGVGFQPDFVIVVPETTQPPYKYASTLPADTSNPLEGGAASVNHIQALETDGFQIGNNATVNGGGNTYHYAAWKAVTGKMAVNTYAGTGVDDLNVPGVGFFPEYVIVQRAAASVSVAKTAASGASTDTSLFFINQANQNNNIQLLQPDGFQVGNHTRVNNGGDTYHYAAFGGDEVNYRSIGTDPNYTTGDVTATTGSTIVIGNGTAWRTANRGRGDRIRIDGLDYQVLSVDSETRLTLRKPFGGTTGSGKTYTLARQFGTLQAWENCISNFVVCTYFPVSSANFVTDNRSEIGIAYDDTPFTAALFIDGSTTDATHTITLTADEGNRHHGVNDGGVVLDNGVNPAAAIGLQDDFVTVEWLEVKNGGAGMDGVQVGNQIISNKVVLRNLLLHDIPNFAIVTINFDIVMDVYNNFIYTANRGIRINGPLNAGARVRILNNTTYNAVSSGIAVSGTGGNILVQNNVVHTTTSGFDFVTVAIDPASSNNLASDGTGVANSPAGGGQDNVLLASLNFVDDVLPVADLHITGGAAEGAGTDLSSVFTEDIDSYVRLTPWDAGADDTNPATNYRSIGTAGPYTTGDVNPTPGSPVVPGLNGALWVTANRGRGDRIQIDGTDYTIFSVDSETQLTLTTPYNGTPGIQSYTVSRQYATIEAWVNCIDGNPCSFFPVGGSSLVADNRREVGVMYKDSTFPLTADVEIDNMVTDASHWITLTADGINRHNGVAGAGVIVDGQNNPSELFIETDYSTVEWLEFIRVRGGDNQAAIRVLAASAPGPRGVLIQNVLIHDFFDAGFETMGIRLSGAGGSSVMIRNSMVWDGDLRGIEADEPEDVLTVENCSIDDMRDPFGQGLHSSTSAVTVRNTIVTRSGITDFSGSGFSAGSSNNTSSDGSAPGANAQITVLASDVFVTPGVDLHLKGAPNVALDSALDLSASFVLDIDGQTRAGLTWDRGADELGAPTAVELVSFSATPLDGGVELTWETASELDNLGFHLYRATDGGPFERITTRLIPGLGSSPEGAKYSYVDSGLDNGITYSYQLEDVETGGHTERHGPLSATPASNATEEEAAPPGITYGDPYAGALNVRPVANGLEIELLTEGFFAEPLSDGTVRLQIPGLDGTPLPVARPWIDTVEGRDAQIASVNAYGKKRFDTLTPAGVDSELVATRRGVVRVRSNRRRQRIEKPNASSTPARILSTGYQGSTRKVQLELSPFQWDPAAGELVLTRRLVVRLVFTGDGAHAPRVRRRGREPGVVARLATREQGLYAIRLVDLVGRRRARSGALRLSRLGEDVPFHVEDGRLFFVSEGAGANPYGNEAVYELQYGEGVRMEARSAPAGGSHHWSRIELEENRYYQAGLLHAPDRWLWELLLAPDRKSFAFDVAQPATEAGPPRLTVFLQSTSDLGGSPDHHVRVYVNGSYLAETYWDGKQAHRLDVDLLAGLLVGGENVLEVENVADTGQAYSMVMLDRFRIDYPKLWNPARKYVIDVTDAEPVWLRAGVDPQRHLLAVAEEELKKPEVRTAPGRLRVPETGADYLAIGPRILLEAARPLLELRRAQGLSVRAIAVDDIYDAFGFGETRPEAIRDFIGHVYHEWPAPKLSYVLLLGDATYDYKDYLGTGVANQVPPFMVKTSYLWTASDPTYAAVNGHDGLPDVAIGRLPAASVTEMRGLVDKILAYESGDPSDEELVALVTDNPDAAGNFVADANELIAGVLSGRDVEALHLSELGPQALREAIIDRFDEGASLVSYLGHGGIHLWAAENVFDTASVSSLSPQGQQPILITMNCLNGYFHFPYFNALAEELLKAENKGVVAAFSPTGLSLNDPARKFHELLLDALLRQGHVRLGDAVLSAQSAYAASGHFPELLSIYHLLGDPALTLR